MPEMSGVEAIEAIRREDEKALIIILTTYDSDEDVYHALSKVVGIPLPQGWDCAPALGLFSDPTFTGYLLAPSRTILPIATKLDNWSRAPCRNFKVYLLPEKKRERRLDIHGSLGLWRCGQIGAYGAESQCGGARCG
jgi:hypothetical protein